MSAQVKNTRIEQKKKDQVAQDKKNKEEQDRKNEADRLAWEAKQKAERVDKKRVSAV